MERSRLSEQQIIDLLWEQEARAATADGPCPRWLSENQRECRPAQHSKLPRATEMATVLPEIGVHMGKVG